MSPNESTRTSALSAACSYRSYEVRLPKEHVDRYDCAIRKRQKPTPTGCGRAWSEEQEIYLIKNRLRKMPYKLIAAHLQKTELACRLHYHQLGIPNRCRQRTSSVSSSSVTSHPPVSSSLESTPGMQRDSGTIISPDGSESIRSIIPREISTRASPQCHVPVLPKPTSSQSQRSNLLRLDTTNLPTHQQHTMPKIDQVRLRQIHDIHHPHFWSLIAKDYGSNIAPTTLEQAWHKLSTTAINIDLLPTPCVSPKSATRALSGYEPTISAPSDRSYSRRFIATDQAPTAWSTSITIGKGTFAISSLLTEEKEVKGPSKEKVSEISS